MSPTNCRTGLYLVVLLMGAVGAIAGLAAWMDWSRHQHAEGNWCVRFSLEQPERKVGEDCDQDR